MRNDRERLLDIQEAIERIERYRARARGVRAGRVDSNLGVISPANYRRGRALSSEFTGQHAEVPWPRIVGMRNILVHNYFGIDVAIVWSVVERDLPSLKQQVASILGG